MYRFENNFLLLSIKRHNESSTYNRNIKSQDITKKYFLIKKKKILLHFAAYIVQNVAQLKLPNFVTLLNSQCLRYNSV